jgi:hypothetical protein
MLRAFILLRALTFIIWYSGVVQLPGVEEEAADLPLAAGGQVVPLRQPLQG